MRLCLGPHGFSWPPLEQSFGILTPTVHEVISLEGMTFTGSLLSSPKLKIKTYTQSDLFMKKIFFSLFSFFSLCPEFRVCGTFQSAYLVTWQCTWQCLILQ